MSRLGDDLRRRSAEQNEQAAVFFKSAEFKTSHTVRASTVIAAVTGNMMSLLAEVVDYLRGEEAIDASAEKRQVRSERFSDLRKAFITGSRDGNFTDYDRIIAELSQPVAGGTGGGEGRNGEPGGGGDVG